MAGEREPANATGVTGVFFTFTVKEYSMSTTLPGLVVQFPIGQGMVMSLTLG